MARATSFSALAAGERAAALVDPGTLEVLEEMSAPSDTLWVGRGAIGGRPVLLAMTDGHRRGGTVGVTETHALAQLAAEAGRRRPAAVVIGWDTGGVRIEEGSPALAALSAVGVALARLALLGTPVATVISGPRGCFGAPAVLASAAHATIMTADAHWGLTGPRLLVGRAGAVAEDVARKASAAAHRRRAGQATVVRDTPAAVRAALRTVIGAGLVRVTPVRVLDECARRTGRLLARLAAPPTRAARRAPPRRKRDLLEYSLRGHWHATGPVVRCGQVHAAWGVLDGRPAMGIIVGPEESERGMGIEEADAVARMVRLAVTESREERAPIVTFLFCRGHANDLAAERVGLHAALAECLRALVVARLLGHPLLCVLGGGAYGAAYLALGAPSHRILALRGTTVAPMAPSVRAAFQRLRGLRDAPATPPDLTELLPEIRVVESIVRLPRALAEELALARDLAAAEVRHSSRLALAVGPPRRNAATTSRAR